MTAIVGVLNKHAVAIAADSAVTIGGRKVMNNANKIFALSKYHPVAIAVYGNAELVGTPWEIIIKNFRKQLGKKEAKNLVEYVNLFFNYLDDHDYFCTQDEADSYLKNAVYTFVSGLIYRYKSKFPDRVNDLKSKIPSNFLEGFSNEQIDHFKSLLAEMFNDISSFLNDEYSINFPPDDLLDIFSQIYTKGIPGSKTGLVFVGYGENEAFPGICSCEIGNIVKKAIAKFPMQKSYITKDKRSMICPFAQTDVMSTILTGVSPKVQEIYKTALKTTFNNVINELADIIEAKDLGLAQRLRNVDREPINLAFDSLSKQSIEKEYTTPFVRSVATLEKEDLADFAESLITLTSLKRKVSLDQETVGGPVDVMIISKGDGIIWKRRKHYFNKDLNHHFFENYFND